MREENTTDQISTNLLDHITSPADLKGLTVDELAQLAEEIRTTIITTVARTGGHLSPNLGVVELTIALHTVFNAPEDKIIWDVGHQCYTHKLLTGRRPLFSTLRQYQGISGFPRRSESPYDVFDVGHSGTSISTALGIAEAHKIKGGQHNIIAVIGDGSINTGLAFEGLNHTGHLKSSLIVVLNDNEMSISPNVGALSSYLSRIITGKAYNRLHSEMLKFLRTIPSIGPILHRAVKQAEGSFKAFIVPGLLFEELGFKYVGPIQGHNIHHLLENLQNIRDLPRRPILFHVLTKKGKGYGPAEEDSELFHGIGPFDVISGKPRKAKTGLKSYTAVFSDLIVSLAQDDPRIVAITAGMTSGTGLTQFKNVFPDRFFDVGIAEPHAVTFAAGLAAEGLRPIVALYSTFLQRAYDQLFQDICLQKLPVIFAVDRGGLVGDDGPTHHGVFDFSFLRSLPHLTIMAPKDENELRHMFYTGLTLNAPVAIRYPRGVAEGVPLDQTLDVLPFGKAETLSEGGDLAILAIGKTVIPALHAASLLEESGIRATVVNSRFVKPLDEELICALARTCGTILTVEENALAGGFGSAVLECLDHNAIYGVRTKRLGIPDQFVEHASQEILREKFSLTEQGIAIAAGELLDAKSSRKAMSRLVNLR
ncbi:MAG TPA: 1-deoxy-D-xylulose-5-phosphate synthase [Thermodesulfobacteriota bacterium]|nr:1-deoxy-D-xylulose-5-phosphate synthase [Thermodesulfobacteriota bacterium]HOC38639.1 1-deoxy-D-xylulose-5-phosphate synthase [Thermodesulfobacteriota bacterium]